jgi:lipoprotein-anchoring transpeptidase ErfK/SrfK
MSRQISLQTHQETQTTPLLVGGLLQRKCDCGQHTIAGGKCDTCSKNRQTIQRASRNSEIETRNSAGVPSIVHDVLRSPGQPLDAATRAFFEPRFGHDFSHVRVHADSRAAASAQAVKALAYTAGPEVVFGAGQYAPGSQAGRHLLAHELTHVIQQGGGPVQTPLSLGPKADAHESEASMIAQSIRSGSGAQWPSLRAGASILRIQRQATSPDDLAVLDVEGEEETGETSEVQDGDSPVNATADAAEVSEETSLEGTILAQAGEATEKAEAAGEGTKGKPKTPPAQKTPPKTITKIEVDQAAQTMTITWSDGTKEGPRPISTGKGQPNTKDDPCKTQTEKNCTPNGDFKVGSLGNGNTKNSHGDRMSWYAGFVDSRGIGIHDSQPVPGTPASHGCVRVGNTPADDAFAKKINKNVVPGTTIVSVSGKAATGPWKKATPAPKKPKKK